MSPKLVKINGKDYIQSGDNLEEVSKGIKTKKVKKSKVGKNELNSAANKAAEAIIAKLPIDELTKAINALNKKDKISPAGKKIIGKSVSKEDISKMDGKERGIKFFKAILTNDRVSAKALSEGKLAVCPL